MFHNIMDRFKKVTQQENWVVNIIIGGAFSYIPILGHALVLGYIMDLLENVKEKKEFTLPKWQNWERLFVEGLPLALLATALFIITFLISFLTGFVVCVGTIISILLVGAFWFFIPAVLTIFAFRQKELQNWQEALNYNSIAEDLKKYFSDFLPILAWFFICGFISFFVGCCGPLIPFPLFFCMVVFFPLLGETYINKMEVSETEVSIPEESAEEKVPSEPKEQPKSEEKKKENELKEKAPPEPKEQPKSEEKKKDDSKPGDKKED